MACVVDADEEMYLSCDEAPASVCSETSAGRLSCSSARPSAAGNLRETSTKSEARNRSLRLTPAKNVPEAAQQNTDSASSSDEDDAPAPWAIPSPPPPAQQQPTQQPRAERPPMHPPPAPQRHTVRARRIKPLPVAAAVQERPSTASSEGIAAAAADPAADVDACSDGGEAGSPAPEASEPVFVTAAELEAVQRVPLPPGVLQVRSCLQCRTRRGLLQRKDMITKEANYNERV